MKLKNFYSLVICLALLASSFSCKESSADPQESKMVQIIDVALCAGAACCNNLKVAEGGKIAGPNSCGEFKALYAVNLEAFGLDQINDCDQTRTIEYALLKECEAMGEEYNCPYVCDMIHGLLIEIINVVD